MEEKIYRDDLEKACACLLRHGKHPSELVVPSVEIMTIGAKDFCAYYGIVVTVDPAAPEDQFFIR